MASKPVKISVPRVPSVPSVPDKPKKEVKINTLNLWSLVKSHDVKRFIEENEVNINLLCLGKNEGNIYKNFKLKITKIRMGISEYDKGGLFIDIQILHNKKNVFNYLHISVHSKPEIHSKPKINSQSHITTNDDFGYNNKFNHLNLNFVKYYGDPNIHVFVNTDNLSFFFNLHKIEERFNEIEKNILKNFLIKTIPNILEKIINSVKHIEIEDDIDFFRSQSYISEKELEYIYNELNEKQALSKRIEKDLKQKNKQKLILEKKISELEEIYTLAKLSKQIKSFQIPDDLKTQYDLLIEEMQELEKQRDINKKEIEELNKRITPYEFLRKYLKYKQKYLKLKKLIN
jgi:hypothetical protein